MNDALPKPGLVPVCLLGIAQILVWGGSFFLMAVLADPVAAETGWPRQWVYGALSLGILVSGLLAPLGGRLIVRYGGRALLGGSGLVIAAGLLGLAVADSLPVFLLAWAVIGAGMAAGLYDALFATLGNLYGARARSSITGITLISGFCTTLVWPVLALLVGHLGWRQTCAAYAVLLALLIWPMYRVSLPAGHARPSSPQAQPGATGAIDYRLYLLLTTIFTLAAVIMTATSVQLITLLQGCGYSLAEAIGLSALLGPSQVGSRVVDILVRKGHPVWTALASVVLVATGLLLIALFPATAAAGVVLYGAGNGLRAIIRGTLPLAFVRQADYAVVTGRMARPALIGQAATPLLIGYLLEAQGNGAVLGLLCALALVNVLLVVVLAKHPRATPAATTGERSA